MLRSQTNFFGPTNSTNAVWPSPVFLDEVDVNDIFATTVLRTIAIPTTDNAASGQRACTLDGSNSVGAPLGHLALSRAGRHLAFGCIAISPRTNNNNMLISNLFPKVGQLCIGFRW